MSIDTIRNDLPLNTEKVASQAEKGLRTAVEIIGRHTQEVGKRLNDPAFQEKIRQLMARAGHTLGEIASPQWNPPSKSEKVSPRKWEFDYDYSHLPTAYTEKHMAGFSGRLSEAMAGLWKIDGNLSKAVSECQNNPSDSNVRKVQSMLKERGGKISKDGNPDGHFGEMTMSAIERIAKGAVENKTTKESQGTENTQTTSERTEVAETANPETAENAAENPNDTEKSTLDKNELNETWKRVIANWQELEKIGNSIKKDTGLFNISDQVDKGIHEVERYLQTNVNDLNRLGENASSLKPADRTEILRQLNLLSEGLRKGSSFSFGSPESREKMTRWAPEIAKIRDKFA